jgi:lysophospholipase L1-like esterase
MAADQGAELPGVPVRNMREPRTASHDDELGNARPALRRFFIATGVLLLFCCVPYLHASMEDYRYLDRIDASPLWRAVTFAKIAKNDASMALQGGLPMSDDGDIESGLAVDPAIRDKPNVDKPPTRSAKVVVKPAVPAKRVAKEPAKQVEEESKSPSRSDQPLPAALEITEDSLAGHTVFIEDKDRAMSSFYEALVGLAYGERDKVRIRHYGDSHIASDGTTHALRVLLQRRFGDAGHGFVLAKARTRWYKHKGIKHLASGRWKTHNFLGGGIREGTYGYGGVVATGGAGQSIRIDTARKGMGSKASLFELFYRSIGTAYIAVTADGKRLDDLVVSQNPGDRWHLVELDDAPHRVRFRIRSGRVRLYGVAVERKRGLVYDSLGVVGARASRWRNVHAGHIERQLKHRKTDLLVLNYGGNARNDKVPERRYVSRYLNVIERLRPEPNEACLIISPSDHGKRQRGKIVSDKATIRLIEWQRRIAGEAGCAFLDARAVMGGEGAMGRWVKQGMGWKDYAHFTPKGMRKMGTAIYAALMHGLMGHLDTTE